MKYGEQKAYEINDKVEVQRHGPGVVVGISSIGTLSVKLLNGELILGVSPNNARPFGGEKC